MKYWLVLPFALFAGACSSEEPEPARPDARFVGSVPAPRMDAQVAVDTGAASVQDGGVMMSMDTGSTAPPPDAGVTMMGSDGGMTPSNCMPFPALGGAPIVLGGLFHQGTDKWRRPADEDDNCPAASTFPIPVPFVEHVFCNTDSTMHSYSVEMIGVMGPAGEPPLDDSYLFIYEGAGIPSNVQQCYWADDDAAGAHNAGIESFVVGAGQTVTIVGTAYEFDGVSGTGNGYFELTVRAVN